MESFPGEKIFRTTLQYADLIGILTENQSRMWHLTEKITISDNYMLVGVGGGKSSVTVDLKAGEMSRSISIYSR